MYLYVKCMRMNIWTQRDRETPRQGGREGERKGSMDDIVVASPVPPAQPFPKLQKAETRDPKQPLHLKNMLPLRCTIGDHLADFKARALVKALNPEKGEATTTAHSPSRFFLL